MSSVNKVILVGHVGKEPEIRSIPSGDKVASFSMATSESWKDKTSGERKERVEWHRVAVFNQGLVSVIEQYVKKGSKLYIEGQLETRKWTDQSGQEKYATAVVMRPFRSELVLLDNREKFDPKAFIDTPWPSSCVDEVEDAEMPF